MKKIIFGLLIVAALGGAYVYFRQSKPITTSSDPDHKLLTGQWKIDSLFSRKSVGSNLSDSVKPILADSSLNSRTYEFLESGQLINRQSGSDQCDTGSYVWKSKDVLQCKLHPSDSIPESFRVKQLDSTFLLVQGDDSKLLRLVRVN